MANRRARQLRNNQTDAERRLWSQLRLVKPRGFHFRRQVPIDHLVVDFACFSARLVIEVDGGQHGFAAGRRTDAMCDQYLRDQGFAVLRFWNNDVMRNIEGVVTEIYGVLGIDSVDPHPNPSPQGGGA